MANDIELMHSYPEFRKTQRLPLETFLKYTGLHFHQKGFMPSVLKTGTAVLALTWTVMTFVAFYKEKQAFSAGKTILNTR